MRRDVKVEKWKAGRGDSGLPCPLTLPFVPAPLLGAFLQALEAFLRAFLLEGINQVRTTGGMEESYQSAEYYLERPLSPCSSSPVIPLLKNP